MSDRETCRGCGAQRPADAPAGLCPACLLKAGLAAEDGEKEDVTILFGPASSSVLAAFGEEFGNIPPVLLRDADSASEPGPVIRPSSDEIPDPAQRSARLQLFGEIARGGMGAVLKGRDADLGRDLAVKILLESHRDKPEMIRRFIEEAQIAGQLQHPGIVPVYELGAFRDRRPYFAMKLVKGRTLAEILASRRSPGEGLTRLLSIFESVCQTMAYAHARGVIHRDLKPSNVMVGSFGEVQVMDWGLAKVLPRGGTVEDASAGLTKDQATVIATARSGSDSDLSRAGSVMGTPSYMAPEQARGEIEDVDERADVFALGSILCEVLSGQPAFTGRNSGEIQRKAARGELAEAVARLDQHTLGHDPELIALAKSCLALERDDRPRNAGAIAERMALYHSRVQERLRQSEIERAAEKARAEEATKRAAVERQRMRLTVALAASVLGLFVLGGGSWAYVARQRLARQAVTEQVVAEALDKATLLRGQAKAAPVGDLSKWSEALAAANEARSSLEVGDPSVALRSRVIELVATLEDERDEAGRRAAEKEKDHKLFERLDAIQFEFVDKQNAVSSGNSAEELVNRKYASAFREFGIDVDRLAPVETARLIRQRANPQEFAFRLDDWALIRKNATEREDEQSWKRLILAAQGADDNQWRNSLRSLIGQADREAAIRLSANEKELDRQPARSLYLLAQVLESTRSNWDRSHYLKESIELLKRAWRISPNDYQICRALGAASERELDRVRFSTAAVAAAPGSPYMRRGLAAAFLPGGALDFTGRSFIFTTIRRGGEAHLKHDPDAWAYARLKIPTKDGQTVLFGPTTFCDLRSVDENNARDAVAELRFATRLAPNSIHLHMSLARALVVQGKYDDAISESQIVRRIDPKYSQGDELGLALYAKRELDRAIQVVRQDIESDPKGNHYDALLAYSYHEQGKKDLAFAVYRELLVSDAAGADALGVEMGLIATGSAAGVTAAYRDAISAHPQNVHLHELLADWLAEHDKTAESAAEFDRIINLLHEQLRSKDGDGPRVRHRLGRAYLRRGRGLDAIAQFRRVLELNPKSSEEANEIAWELTTNREPALRNGKIAVEFATKACEATNWKNSAYLDTLAAAYAESGEFDAAVKWQIKAIELLTDKAEQEDYNRRLRLYQKKKPYQSDAKLN
jgi:tetratricopeptide (TPR) repeat protein/tRNA A-37 threonylcarbamoyl transferase component Bud32